MRHAVSRDDQGGAGEPEQGLDSKPPDLIGRPAPPPAQQKQSPGTRASKGWSRLRQPQTLSTIGTRDGTNVFLGQCDTARANRGDTATRLILMGDWRDCLAARQRENGRDWAKARGEAKALRRDVNRDAGEYFFP